MVNVYAGSHSSCLLREQTLDFILRFISKNLAMEREEEDEREQQTGCGVSVELLNTVAI